MTIEEAYRKYKHMDKVLSDHGVMRVTYLGSIAFDLWQAVKEEAIKTEVQEAPHETVP